MTDFYKKMAKLQSLPRDTIMDQGIFCNQIRWELDLLRIRFQEKNLMNQIIFKNDILTIKEYFPEIAKALKAQIKANQEISRILKERNHG